MSLEIPSSNTVARTNSHELRVIALHSEEKNHIIMPHNNRLPVGYMEERETFEHSAQRIAHETFNLDNMKTVVHVPHPYEKHLSAHVIEAAYRTKTDLRRSFAARAIDLSIFLEEDAYEKYDEIDLALLRTYAQCSGLQRAPFA